MNGWRAMWVVARRDFVAIVFTPTFLLFLLAPLFMVALGVVGGGSASIMAANADASEKLVAMVPADEAVAIRAADARLRGITRAPRIEILPQTGAAAQADFARLAGDANVRAIMVGRANAPTIRERQPGSGQYLATLAEAVAREGVVGAARGAASHPTIEPLVGAKGGSRAGKSAIGYGAVFGLFLLTLLLGGQTVGMLAEEKGNKVIEILAAAAPLRSIFLGKLFGMLAVALLFIGFWLSLLTLASMALGAGTAGGGAGGAAMAELATGPAVGWPIFLLLVLAYFIAAFLLLGAVFLGVGAQASTVREIQMLSLPITLFQVGMFSLSSAAANLPGSKVAMIAEILPWSSPFAMAARAANDAALWPHILALGWQAFWVLLTIRISEKFFRIGVLKSGGGGLRWPWRRTAS